MKKKLAILTDPKTNYQGKFIDGLMAHGASKADANKFWDQLLDFARYAFNKSHAAAYATVSYMTAWLKYHYPAEYMCSVMSRTTFSKLPQLVGNCRKMGLTILAPAINHSMNGFVSDEKEILYGLGNIKGIGNAGNLIIAERNERGPFVSVKDFVKRMLTGPYAAGYDKSVMENLIKCGAFDEFCDGNRRSLLDSIEEFAALTKKLADKTAILNERTTALDELRRNGASETDIKKAERSVASVEKTVKAAQEMYVQHLFVGEREDQSRKLADEYELLGVYLSGNPFSEYSDAADAIKNRTMLSDIGTLPDRSTATVCGIIKDVVLKQRNRDGMTFALFNLFDETGELAIKCFVSKYSEYGDLIQGETAVKIVGKVSTDGRPDDSKGEAEGERYISVDKIETLQRNANERILVNAFSVADWVKNLDAIKKYRSANGYELIYTDVVDLTLRRTGLRVSKDILTANLAGLTFSVSSIK